MDRLGKGRDAWRKGELTTKGREAKRNDERLFLKFIVKYMEGLHPEIYTKAVQLHNTIRENNPGVSDLTKTVLFMSTVTPEKRIPRYYFNRSINRPKQPQMVLNIQLLDHEQLSVPPQQSSPQLPVPPSQQPSPQLPVPPPQQPAPQLPVPPPQQSSPQQSAPQLPVPPPQQPSPQQPVPQLPVPLPQQQLPLLPPNVYEDILAEIQRDPELYEIFNDITDDQTLNEFVWDDLYMLNDISPLENHMDMC